ncbi:MAG: hypothetical protein LBK56_15330 [Gracilibacteraceae bacterium]|nr:hypothetical protein [Gracilibacteraceae bacterium]
MSKTTAAAKEAWNAAHYTQVKISVKPEIAAAFKSACAAGGASMAGVLSRCMSEYAGIAVKLAALPVETRPNRRQAVRKIAQLIKEICDAEEGYKNRIPQNLAESERYMNAEESVSKLEEAVEALAEAY